MSISDFILPNGEQRANRTKGDRRIRRIASLGEHVRRRTPRLAITLAVAGLLVVAESRHAFADDRDPSSIRSAAIATIGGNLFDGLTTIAALKSGHARETNPLLGQKPTRILVIKGLFTVPQLLAEKHLADHGHPTAAKWLGYAVGGFGVAFAVRNLHVRSSTH